MGKKSNQYIRSLAKTMSGQLGLKTSEYDKVPVQKLGSVIFAQYSVKLREKLQSMSLQTRAKIAAQGNKEGSSGCRSLKDVHLHSNWISGSLSGEEIIMLVAITAICAAIFDMMMEDRRSRKAGGLEPVDDSLVHVCAKPRPAQTKWRPDLDYYDTLTQKT